ncbi:ParB N-terminal domain-containing protein [Streptomyces sp. NPDC001108]
MAKTATTPVPVWDMVDTARLTAEAADVVPAAELVESVRANGIADPLYVTLAAGGAMRVIDGRQRLAAAVAANLPSVPVTFRPVIRTSLLAAHPGNVRQDLKVGKALLLSVRADGIRTALIVTQHDGAWRVVDGHRRLAAAIAEKLTHVPYTVDQRDEAGQMLDMVTTARHREGLTETEEAAALFAAAELGATPKRLAAAAGLTQVEAKRRARIGGSAAVRQAGAVDTRYTLTMDHMAKLAELEAIDPEAAATIAARVQDNPDDDHRWHIERALNRAQDAAAAEEHRAELESQGAAIRTLDELSERAQPLARLPISREEHATCQGAVWVLETGDSEYTRYCTNPPLYGHPAPTSPNQAPVDKEAARKARRAIIDGNKDWDAAQTIRREWIADLLGRKRHAKATNDIFMSIMARELFSQSDVLARYNGVRGVAGEWLGVKDDRDALMKRTQTATRNPVNMFAVLAACYEDATPRHAWRTDGDYAERDWHYTVRPQTRRWLSWLVELGYEPTPIEQAIIDATDYTGGGTQLT